MNVEQLKKYQTFLEQKYNEIENDINNLEENDNKREKLENLQIKIDEQLDLLDDIIEGIYEVPKKYNELLNLKKEYERLSGE